MKVRFAFAFSLLLAQPAFTQEPEPASKPVKVAFETGAGRFVVAVDLASAPVTAANFLKYVDHGRFDGESFYRAMPYGEGEGLIQGGITSDAAKLYPPIPHEPTSQTGLKHVAGTVSMGRGEPGSARADFFILTTDIPGFDADPAREGDNQGYAAFGRVIEGMDVVRRIFASPVSPTRGEGAMKGQMLEPAVKIGKVERLKD